MEIRKSWRFMKRYWSSKGPNDESIIPINLAYASYENQKTKSIPPVLLLHGFLASKRNWVTVCKRLLEETKPQRKIIAVDLRNHGDSPHSDEHTYLHVVEDIRFFLESHQLKTTVLLGHSYGGLASMLMCLTYPDLVEKLIVEDMAPVDQTENFKAIKEALDAASIISVPPKAPMSIARSLVDQQLMKSVPEKQYREFLLTQLVQKSSGKYSWRFNVKVLRKHIVEAGVLPSIQGKMFEKPTIFIAGEKSPFMKKSDEIDIKKYFPMAEFHYIQGAAHVVHLDKHLEFIKICSNFLNQPSIE